MAYQPAANLTTNVGHYQTIWYNRKGLDQLKKKFRFLPLTEPDQIPQRSGKVVQ